MYYYVRVIPMTVILVISGVLLRDTKFMRKFSWRTAIFFSWLALSVLIQFVPVENLFANFETAEDLLSYTTTAKKHFVSEIVYGEGSCLVVHDNGGYYFDVLPMKDGSFKIASPFTVREIVDTVNYNRGAAVTTVKGTNDYYVTGVLPADAGELAVFDGAGNEIDVEITRGTDGASFDSFYFYLDEFSEDYYITFDDVKMVLSGKN